MRSAFRFAALLAVLGTMGCGTGRDPDLPDLVPVSGTVLLDGKPLPGASVYFTPVGSTKGTGSTGVTDAAGKYTLATLHNGVGAPVGDYQVVISKIVMPDGSDFPKDAALDPMSTPHKNLLAAKYSDPNSSMLKATVPAGGGELDFPLTSQQ